MSNMEQGIPEAVSKLVEKESQVITQEKTGNAKLRKALEKRLKANQKLAFAILGYHECHAYPGDVGKEEYIELFDKLKREQNKLQTHLADAF